MFFDSNEHKRENSFTGAPETLPKGHGCTDINLIDSSASSVRVHRS